MSEENKAISNRWVEEVFGQRDLDALDEFVSPEFVNHDPAIPEEVRGPEGFREIASGYLNAFPDLQVTVEDQVAEGDRVVTRWRARGTHQAELMGIPPSGNQVDIDGITIDRIVDGQIVESWDNWDALGMMQQLGALPTAGAA